MWSARCGWLGVVTKLTTSRLFLRPLDSGDAAWLCTHWSRPEVRRHLFDDETVSPELVDEIVKDSAEDFAAYGYGLWLVDVGGEPSGVCGLRATDDGLAELLYSLDPPFQGRGLATEAAAAVLDHAVGVLGLAEVVAEIDEGNVASIQVIRRLGLAEQAERQGPNGILKRFVLSVRDVPDA